MTRVLCALLALAFGSGCAVVVRGGPLSGEPATREGRQLYISTGSPKRAYQTLGFVQVRGYGVEVAGVLDVGDAALDGTLRGALVDAAAKMGGDGVINVEFLDENPSTPVERAQAAASSVSNLANPQNPRGPEQKPRYVTATGEVIRFLDAP